MGARAVVTPRGETVFAVSGSGTNWLDDDPSVFFALRPVDGPFQSPVAVARDPQARWPAVAIHGNRRAAAWLSDGNRGLATTLP